MKIFPKAGDAIDEIRSMLLKVNPMFESIPADALIVTQPELGSFNYDGKNYNTKITVSIDMDKAGFVGHETLYYNRRRLSLFNMARFNVNTEVDGTSTYENLFNSLPLNCNLSHDVVVGHPTSDAGAISSEVVLKEYNANLINYLTYREGNETVAYVIQANGVSMAERIPDTLPRHIFESEAHLGYLKRALGSLYLYANPDIYNELRYMPMAVYGYDMAPVAKVVSAAGAWTSPMYAALNYIQDIQNLPHYTEVYGFMSPDAATANSGSGWTYDTSPNRSHMGGINTYTFITSYSGAYSKYLDPNSGDVVTGKGGVFGADFGYGLLLNTSGSHLTTGEFYSPESSCGRFHYMSSVPLR